MVKFRIITTFLVVVFLFNMSFAIDATKSPQNDQLVARKHLLLACKDLNGKEKIGCKDNLTREFIRANQLSVSYGGKNTKRFHLSTKSSKEETPISSSSAPSASLATAKWVCKPISNSFDKGGYTKTICTLSSATYSFGGTK